MSIRTPDPLPVFRGRGLGTRLHRNNLGNYYWKSRERETGICAKRREETTARKDFRSLRSPGIGDGAHGDLVHELRSTKIDFEFHLYHLIQQSELEDLYEKRVHTPTWTIDTVITHHSLGL